MKDKIIATIVFLGVIGIGVTIYLNYYTKQQNLSPQEKPPVVDDENNNFQEENDDEQSDNSVVEDETIATPEVSTDQPFPDEAVNKPTVPVQNPETSDDSESIEQPGNNEQPVIPENPEDSIEDLLITNDMIINGVYTISNQKYNSITLSSDIENYAKIVFDNIEINEYLTLENPGRYQLDVMDSSVPVMLVTNNMGAAFSFRSIVYTTMNKSLPGATVNFKGDNKVQSISIGSNIEVNGTTSVSNIEILNANEVVLNIPSQNLFIDTVGVVVVNKETNAITNMTRGAEINVNASVANMTNLKGSTIRISEGNTITNFHNLGENTSISGNGSVVNMRIEANDTRIYTSVTNNVEASDSIDYLIRQESKINIIRIQSREQGSVTFTLSESVPLTLKDVSVICMAGKSIDLFHLTSSDNKTYTLTTNYYKNDSYSLYITLPNGNIISRDFDTDYANPQVTDIVLERKSDTEAILKLYGVDEGGQIYYILQEKTVKENIDASTIKLEGKAEAVKVGFNSIVVKNLEPGKSYNLYYVIEGFYQNITNVKGPFEISNQVKEENQSKYVIEYAKEEISNRFVFTLNRVPEKELTLEDFEIECPTGDNLTIENATFYVSPNLKTYIIVVPNNYAHKDNEYNVKIRVSENETIEKYFVTHMNPPSITNDVDGVVRTSKTSALFTFDSDEPGTVYYGIYEWNGGIYDYNSTTPFASDIISGTISGKSQPLNRGANTINIDLSDIDVTRTTRFWALFVDEVGNYRVGFVNHYRIPEYVETTEPDSELAIIDFTHTNETFNVTFNQNIGDEISPSDVSIAVKGAGSLPGKLLFATMYDEGANKVTIHIQNNLPLPVGIYEISIYATDQNGNAVVLTKVFEIK